MCALSDAGYHFLANNGRTFYFKTNKDAPNGKIISLQLPEPGHEFASTEEALATMKTVRAPCHCACLRDSSA